MIYKHLIRILTKFYVFYFKKVNLFSFDLFQYKKLLNLVKLTQFVNNFNQTTYKLFKLSLKYIFLANLLKPDKLQSFYHYNYSFYITYRNKSTFSLESKYIKNYVI